MEDNGWLEYKNRVLFQLEQTDKNIKDMNDEINKRLGSLEAKLDKLNTDVVVLKTKAIVYGAVAGFIITVFIQVLLNSTKLG